MDKYRDRYATIKARGMENIEYTLTMHKFPVRRAGIEDKKSIRQLEEKAEAAMLKAKGAMSFVDNKEIGLREKIGLEKLPVDFWNSASNFPSETTAIEDDSQTRFDSSICRSRSAVVQYAANNPWDYFVTLTFDPKREGLNMDLKDLSQVKKKVMQFFVNYSRRSGAESEFKYLLVPEFHKSGNVHFHGFMKGINKADLFKNDNGHLDFKPYRDKFGFCSMSKIKDQNKAAVYATKYINKDMFIGQDLLPNTHLYFASKGLKKDELICKGTYTCDVEDFCVAGYDCYDFAYCSKVTTTDLDALKSVVQPFAGFVEGINDNSLSRKTVFSAYMRQAHYERDDKVYNNKISSFLNNGTIEFDQAIKLWRDDWTYAPRATMPEKKELPVFTARDEHMQQNLKGWGKNEVTGVC